MAHDLTDLELVAGRYRLLRRLARGGGGEVFVAQDQSTGQQVVMHHYRMRLARLTGDRDALQTALADMREAAFESNNPAVHALSQRLSEERSSHSESPHELDDLQAG